MIARIYLGPQAKGTVRFSAGSQRSRPPEILRREMRPTGGTVRAGPPPKERLGAAILAFLFFLLAAAFSGADAQAAPASSKTLMVYYMPWFSAKPYSSQWGWHWTMDRCNPDQTNAVGQRQIASWYYPLIGPYDSADPAVLEYHVLLMKLAGVDGVIVDWYGSTDYLDYGANNTATLKLFAVTRRAGLKFALCYEDQTIRHLIDGGRLTADGAVAQAQKDMQYLQTNWFADPLYLRLMNRPVLLNFGPQYFLSSSNWDEVFSVLAAGNQPAFFNEDNRLPVSLGAFDWPPMWMSHAPGTGGILSAAALRSYLAAFDQKAAAWPAFISSAFPRFHEIYQPAGGDSYLGYIGDHHGDTFRETLARGMTNSSAVVQVVTWNDFGEGTVIEPTQEYGYRDLGLLQDYRRRYLEPGFAATTNDLALAYDFFRLRTLPPRQDLSQNLDEIFSNVVSGNLAVAKRQLDRLHPLLELPKSTD